MAAFPGFTAQLTATQRKAINGSASPAWETRKTFAYPVNPDSPAYTSEDGCPVVEVLNELSETRGALPKIALWLHDRMGGLDAVQAVERLRIAVTRICEAKNPRLEAQLAALAIGMNLDGNNNGFEIARHFGLTPQAFHEILGDTCSALGLPKPLAKMKTDRYRKTQYTHNLPKRRIPATA